MRYLGPNDFGLISYALSIIGILHPLSTLGLDAIIFRNIIRDKKNEKIIIKTSYLIRIVSGTILFLCTSLWFYFHGDNSVFNFIIFILAIGFILDAFVVYEGYFAAILQNKYISLSNIVSNIRSNGKVKAFDNPYGHSRTIHLSFSRVVFVSSIQLLHYVEYYLSHFY